MKRIHRLTIALLVLLCSLLFAACAFAAEIIPLDFPDDLSLADGTFSLTIQDEDKRETGGYFTAELYLEDRYDGAQIRALAPGDTVWMNGSPWTVHEIVTHDSIDDDASVVYEVYPEEEYYGYLVFTPCADGTFHALIDDWVPVTRVGEVRVMLPLPNRFSYVPISAGEEESPEDMDGFLSDLGMFGGFNAYNTSCVFEDGLLVKIVHSSYPEGPEEYWPGDYAEPEMFEEQPIWQFCGGSSDGLESAEISGCAIDCEAGPIAFELTDEEKEEIRRLAMYGVVTGKENDTMTTGGTNVYYFENSEGECILAIELYSGLIVGRDGMYAYVIRQD